MSEDNHGTLLVLKTQYTELCRRIEEIRTDVRAEEGETRAEMRQGFDRIGARTEKLEERVRAGEQADVALREQLSTWRLLAIAAPLVSGVVAGLISFAKELINLLN